MMKTVGILLLCLAACAYAEDEEEKVPSACEIDRARRLNRTVTDSILHLIPDCEDNGDYAALQCFTSNDWCVCYRRNGENINTPSKKIKACDCVRARDDALTNEEDYTPRCTREGYYEARQCKEKLCWCVDQKGNMLTDPAPGDVKC